MPTLERDEEFASLIGSVVGGKYRIERSIGRGGMGAVFQATNIAIGKRVALKFLSRDAAKDRAAAQRFQREAEAASTVESAHIVQIFDSGRTDDDRPFLVMELLTGEDLRARLRREEQLSPEIATRIACQVLRALTRAHRGGIVHRDLKPDNIFLCARDDDPAFVKVVDFGISKLARSSKLDTLTQRGTVLGTVFYMAPEQAQSLPDIDGRTDLFSLGAILFEMLAGRPPFTGPTYEAVLVSICTKDAEDVRSFAPAVSEAMAEVVARALSRDREQRFQSAEEFLNALSAAADDSASAALPRTQIGISRTAKVSKRRGGYGTLVLSAVATLMGFAVAAYFIATTRAARLEAAAEQERSSYQALKSATEQPTLAASASAIPKPTPPPPAASAELTTIIKKSGNLPIRLSTAKTSPVKITKSPAPSSSSGVARSLELSTREP